tara:strand:- start:316 stop:444 length:129 start_codon:yes stop_codon:yes gene_type:complete
MLQPLLPPIKNILVYLYINNIPEYMWHRDPIQVFLLNKSNIF